MCTCVYSSYLFIRNLGTSSEELCPRVLLDGAEYVVIPADTYSQMQGDLAVLRQQLAELSSIMLEVGQSGRNYRSHVQNFGSWCNRNNLSLRVTKN